MSQEPPVSVKRKGSWRGALLRWVAQRYGLGRADPYITALSGLARTPEVAFPKELVPMLATQSARALLAAQVFQAGPHYVWPYWVERQLDPRDPAYLPRAMCPLWHNLTHRNWTAIGVPDGLHEGVVDPRGLLMAQRGAWSLDTAVLFPGADEAVTSQSPAPDASALDGKALKGAALCAPSRLKEGYEQTMAPDLPLVTGRFQAGPLEVTQQAWAERMGAAQMARLTVTVKASARAEAWLALSLRPYNPEGPAVVNRIDASADGWLVESVPAVVLEGDADRMTLSTFWDGDALFSAANDELPFIECAAGQASAAAFWKLHLKPGEQRVVRAAAFIDPLEANAQTASQVRAMLSAMPEDEAGPSRDVRSRWREKRNEGGRIELPDRELQRVFEQAHTTLLVLDDVDSIKPGPFTYHQHWFRDSAYLVTALARLGHRTAARQKLADYNARQDKDGFYRSQEGEWDSNGQAIWTLVEHDKLFGDEKLLKENWAAIERGARWIMMKRREGTRPPGASGLLPAGISAEHLGPHDYYFWDDFWGVAGLRGAAYSARRLGHEGFAKLFDDEADLFLGEIELALKFARDRGAASEPGRDAMPAAPQRRFDAGMIGNVASVYPLSLFEPDDARVTDTLKLLEERFFVDDAFLQAMVHSGYNPYLTLQCAQVYLARRDRESAWRLLRRVQQLATSTGTWPEAVHPRTLGGCMGDGCHGWSAAELVLFVRNALLVEERERLVITPVFPDEWRRGVAAMDMPTHFGRCSLSIEGDDAGKLSLRLELEARRTPEAIVWRLPAPASFVVVDGERRDDLVGQEQLVLPPTARKVDVSA